MRAAIVALALVVGGVAGADAVSDKAAHEHYNAAQKAFDAADYETALSEFQRSYALTPYPAIQYKIALCHDQLGHAKEALDAYRAYLVADPQTTRRRGIEARIEKLGAAAPVEKPAAPVTPPPEKPAVVAPPPVEAAPATPAAPAAVPGAALAQAPAEAPHKTPLYKKWWLWTVVGVVVAGAAVGGALAATLPKDASIPAGAIPVHFPSGVTSP
jgi:tetratricopeptide (TPR) repeat protein